MNTQPNHLAVSGAEIGSAIANANVDAEVEELWQWGEGFAAVPLIAHFREEMNRIRERELATALKRLAGLAPAQRAAVERLSLALMNEFMHEPSVRLGTAAADDRGLGIVAAARYLFALDDAPAPAEGARGEEVRAA